MSFVKTFLDNTLFVTPSFQIIFKLTQSFLQRFVGGANSPDSKSYIYVYIYMTTYVSRGLNILCIIFKIIAFFIIMLFAR